jgi:uncharacterized protein YbjT (DUF2867 family)
MTGKILVVGATGHVGTPLVEALVARGAEVKAASRHASPVAGATPVHFDFADEESLVHALEGVDRAFILAPTGQLDVVSLLTPLIGAAIDRRVKIVLQTVIGVDADDSIPYRQIEIALERAAPTFVILRPNWFADNFHTYWLNDIRNGAIAVPAGGGKSSFIDVRDIAASAAAALTTDRFDGRAFNLTGPEALGYRDAAEILSKVAGRSIGYRPVDDETFVAHLIDAGLPEAHARVLAAIFQPVRAGETAEVTDAVRELTGKAPRSLETYARDHAELFKA